MIGSIRRHSITHEARLKRKNFLPTLLLAIALWLSIAGLIYFVEPDTLGALPTFFILAFLALLFAFSLIFANTRRGLVIAVGLTIFLILRYLGIGNILNLLLISGLVTVAELYFSNH